MLVWKVRVIFSQFCESGPVSLWDGSSLTVAPPNINLQMAYELIWKCESIGLKLKMMKFSSFWSELLFEDTALFQVRYCSYQYRKNMLSTNVLETQSQTIFFWSHRRPLILIAKKILWSWTRISRNIRGFIETK